MQIIIPFNIAEKLRHYVEAIDDEISGFGKISINNNHTITIEDLTIFEQEVTGASSSLDGASIANFMTEMTKANQSLEGWNLWWHSHNDMDTFWSTTDTNTMDENPTKAPFMLSLVTNNKRQFRARLDTYEPFAMNLDDIPVFIDYPKDNTLKSLVEKEVKKFIKKPKPLTLISSHYPKFHSYLEPTTTPELSDWTHIEMRAAELAEKYTYIELEKMIDFNIFAQGRQATQIQEDEYYATLDAMDIRIDLENEAYNQPKLPEKKEVKKSKKNNKTKGKKKSKKKGKKHLVF